MRVLIAGLVALMGTGATADVAVAPETQTYYLFHEAKMNEEGCHKARSKRKNYHCHEMPERPDGPIDVTNLPDSSKVASASE